MYISRRVFIFVPGIRQHDIGGVHGWADRAVRWVARNTDHVADRYEYCSTATLRWIGQPKRVRDLRDLVEDYAGREITIVGHSNGCEIALRMLREFPETRVRSLHLFGAAAHSSYEKNGLNKAIYDARVGMVNLYGSKNDTILKLGGFTRRGLGWIGLGYGELGRVGPEDVASHARAVTRTDWRDSYGHSTWFEPENMEETLRMACELSNA